MGFFMIRQGGVSLGTNHVACCTVPHRAFNEPGVITGQSVKFKLTDPGHNQDYTTFLSNSSLAAQWPACKKIVK